MLSGLVSGPLLRRDKRHLRPAVVVRVVIVDGRRGAAAAARGVDAAAPPPPPANHLSMKRRDLPVAARLSVVFLPSPRRFGGSRECSASEFSDASASASATAKTRRACTRAGGGAAIAARAGGGAAIAAQYGAV